MTPSAQVGVEFAGVVIAALALVVSTLGFLHSRSEKRARLDVSVRFEYRACSHGRRVRARGASQEELLASLAEFLRVHDLGYADGEAVVSFVLTNRGNTAVYPKAARLLLLSAGNGEPLVVDTESGSVRASEYTGGAEDVAAASDRRLPDHIPPGKSVGMWCGLPALSRILVSEGLSGEVELAVCVRDQLGNRFTAPFTLDAGIWLVAPSRESG